MAPVDAAETVGQIAAKPGADDPRDANGDAEHQSGLSRAEAVRALEQDQRPKILAIGEEGNKRSADRSEEHTSELQSLMRISYAVFCLKKKNKSKKQTHTTDNINTS